MSVGSRQKVRLFLEGYEVPLQAAVITSTIGAPVAATISLVPLSQIKFVKPRTQVRLFMQDTKNFADDNFYLVFEGEVVGRVMAKKQDSRVFQIMAVDYSSYWDSAQSYTMNPNFVLGKIEDTASLDDAPLGQVTKALGGAVIQTSATTATRTIEIMLATDNNIPETQADGNKDLARGALNVVKTLATVNQFFSTAFERLRINDRLQLFSGGNVQKFLQQLLIDDWLKDFAGKNGGVSSLRELLTNVMSLVFHDFISVPFPAYIPANATTSSTGLQPGAANPSAGKTISQFLFVPDGYSLPAPMCNVVFPNQQMGYTFQEDFRDFPTRYAFKASIPLINGNGSGQITFPVQPMQFFPTAFSDYMFGKDTATATEIASELGPSTLLTDAKTGNTYKQIFYGNKSSANVGTSFGGVLREADYLSNEESLKGIFFAMDNFMPSYTALVKNASAETRSAFIESVGSYLFFKKRFSARQITAELIFHPFLVPGFNTLFLDDSEAGQSFTAKLQSVSHTLTNDGCTTAVSLAYGRDFDEVDALTGGSDIPPPPPWFDPTIFGGVDTGGLFQQETAYLLKVGAITQTEATARGQIVNPVVYPQLSTFFQAILGVNAVTNYTNPSGVKSTATPNQPVIVSTRGAVSYLLQQYNKVSQNPVARDKKVRKLTSRPLVPLLDAFDFVGAQPVGFTGRSNFNLPEEFASFVAKQTGNLPGRFDGTGPKGPYADLAQIKLRRQILTGYVHALKTQVGFRG